jgi:hypothetical protein
MNDCHVVTEMGLESGSFFPSSSRHDSWSPTGQQITVNNQLMSFAIDAGGIQLYHKLPHLLLYNIDHFMARNSNLTLVDQTEKH